MTHHAKAPRAKSKLHRTHYVRFWCGLASSEPLCGYDERVNAIIRVRRYVPHRASPLITARAPCQTLMFDADDTLWQNNIYFERAIAAFISYLDHQVHTAAEVRERLNEVERATIARHGYGVKSFRRSLVQCFEQMTLAPVSEAMHRRIVSFADSIAEQEMELLPGVADTLNQLARRHRLLLVTKGDEQEQRDKVTRSGLSSLFAAIEVLPEKEEQAYRALLERHRCTVATTWMVGNSPKSDINPALAAGINAVFLPHESTWVLEQEIVNAPQPQRRLLTLDSFRKLLLHF